MGKEVWAIKLAEELGVNLQQVLDAAGKPDGNERSRVNPASVKRKLTKSEPKSRGGTRARNHRKGASIRERRDAKRAPREGLRILPGDLVILQEVQNEVDRMRKPLPKSFTPKVTKKAANGEVAYMSPTGMVTVPALDFAKMHNGTMPWKQADPSPAEVRKLAKKLQKLSFLPKECRFCHREIASEYAPEYAQVWQCIKGRFALPYINYQLEPHQSELRFRHMHLQCSLWENHLADLLIASPKDLVGTLTTLRQEVFEEAVVKRPNITMDEIDEALDAALVYMDKEGS